MTLIMSIIGMVSGGSQVLIATVSAILAFLGLLWGAKRSGRKEALNEVQARTTTRAYESASTRLDVERVVNTLSDDELNKLQSRYQSESY